MSAIEQLFVAMTTRNTDNSGTDSSIMLIANIQGNDRIQYTFPDSSQSDQEQGQANLYSLPAFAEIGMDTKLLPNTYFRVGIRGDDAWRPEHFFLWGTSLDLSQIFPLAIGVDLHNSNVERSEADGGTGASIDVLQVILSTDFKKGDLSFPLLPIAVGNSGTPINRLLMLLTTADKDDAGTDDTINLQIANNGQLIVDFDIPHSPQAYFKRGQANFYFVPVNTPFVKNNLNAAKAITLTIEGDDAWVPDRFFLFGLDTSAGMPTTIVPLVHLPNWPFGVLSTDGGEGKSFVNLPLAPGA